METSNKIFFTLSIIVLVWSGFDPADRFTWFLEVGPSFIGLPLLYYLHKKESISHFLFITICMHSIILSVGGRYTYAEVPIGFWAKETFDFSRNHYDRVGHFFQGVTPTFICFEMIKSKRLVNSFKWALVFSISVGLAFSAFYELIEWLVAEASGDSADAFLGAQGDIWDTQWDMFLALIGSIFISTFLYFKNNDTYQELIASH